MYNCMIGSTWFLVGWSHGDMWPHGWTYQDGTWHGSWSTPMFLSKPWFCSAPFRCLFAWSEPKPRFWKNAYKSSFVYRFILFVLLGRPTYLSADIGFTGILPILLFALYNLQACWTELDQNRPHARTCDLKMHVQNLGYPLPYKSGVQKPPFSAISQLNGNFNGPYLRKETRHRQSAKCVGNYKGSPTSSRLSKRHELWSKNGLQVDRSFRPHSKNSAFFFIAGLCTHTSNHKTQPNFATRRGVNHGNKLP